MCSANNQRRFLSIGLAICMLAPAILRAASFDCDRAATKVEKAICADPVLSQLDETLAKVYQQALSVSSEPTRLKNEQLHWLREGRNSCSDNVCLEKAYHDRLDALATKHAAAAGVIGAMSDTKTDHANTGDEITANVTRKSRPGNALPPSLCDDARNEMELGECLAGRSEGSADKLHAVEERIAKRLDPEGRKLFESASAAWRQFVDATCNYEGHGIGTMMGSLSSTCRIELNTSRVEGLEDYEQCLITDNCGRPILLFKSLLKPHEWAEP